MEQDELCGDAFQDIKPGWVYDPIEKKIVSRDDAPCQNSPVVIGKFPLLHDCLKRWTSESKCSTKNVWQEEFEKSEEKHCFLLRYTGSYSSKIQEGHCLTPGTVTEINFTKSIAILICSSEENSYKTCSKFLKNIIERSESEVDDTTVKACKVCFLYDGDTKAKCNKTKFSSVIAGLKEVARIVSEMGTNKNFNMKGFKFLKNIEAETKNILSTNVEPNCILDQSKLVNENENEKQSFHNSYAMSKSAADVSCKNNIVIGEKQPEQLHIFTTKTLNSSDPEVTNTTLCENQICQISSDQGHNMDNEDTRQLSASSKEDSTSKFSSTDTRSFLNSTIELLIETEPKVNKENEKQCNNMNNLPIKHNEPFVTIDMPVDGHNKHVLNDKLDTCYNNVLSECQLADASSDQSHNINHENLPQQNLLSIDLPVERKDSNSRRIIYSDSKSFCNEKIELSNITETIVNKEFDKHGNKISSTLPIKHDENVASIHISAGSHNNYVSYDLLNSGHNSLLECHRSDIEEIPDQKLSAHDLQASIEESTSKITDNDNKPIETTSAENLNENILEPDNPLNKIDTNFINNDKSTNKNLLKKSFNEDSAEKSDDYHNNNSLNGLPKVKFDQIENAKQNSKRKIMNSDNQLTRNYGKQETINYRDKEIDRTISNLNGLRREEIGRKKASNMGKTVLLLGATGSGKTALVNLVANFYFGSPSAEEEKLFVDESKSKTDRVTVYTFYPENECHIPITVIDTPGLNDSTGAEIHDHVDTLKSFLAVACSHGLEIHAIGFVAQAHLARLTTSEELVMDHVTSLFGADIQKHIIVLVTFSDHMKVPPVIEAMKQYGLKSPVFEKFNNTLLINRKGEVDDLDTINWRTGLKSWKKCLKLLSKMKPLSTAAISTVQIEVFNKSVITKRSEILRSEINTLITMCSRKKDIRELYLDEDLRKQRNKVWMASNIVYNLGEVDQDKLKETFLMKACLSQLQDKPDDFSSVILLFILIDSESAMRNAIIAVLNSLVECDKALNSFSPSNDLKKSLVSMCMKCNKNCFFKKAKFSSYAAKFECKCGCESGWHGPTDQSLTIKSQLNLRRKLFVNGYQCIQEVISPFISKNFVLTLLEHLMYSEPDYLKGIIGSLLMLGEQFIR